MIVAPLTWGCRAWLPEQQQPLHCYLKQTSNANELQLSGTADSCCWKRGKVPPEVVGGLPPAPLTVSACMKSASGMKGKRSPTGGFRVNHTCCISPDQGSVIAPKVLSPQAPAHGQEHAFTSRAALAATALTQICLRLKVFLLILYPSNCESFAGVSKDVVVTQATMHP